MHTLKEIFYDILDAASATPEVSMQQDIKALLPVNGNGTNKNVVIINNQNVSINNVTSLAVKGLRALEAQDAEPLPVYDNVPQIIAQGIEEGINPMDALAEYCYENKIKWREAQDRLKEALLKHAIKTLGTSAAVATRLELSLPQVTSLKKKYKLSRQTTT